mgnify:CR=1 FL=1
MIFLRLFLVFSYIGLFNFGGGYAMLSFIQQEVVVKNQWVSQQEFTDIVAISNMTPGPIGINCATYVGYTSVMNDEALQASVSPAALQVCGVLGSVLATVSVLWLPFVVMLLVSRILIRFHSSWQVTSVFAALRPAIIGLLASAVLVLMTVENFSNPRTDLLSFLLSVAICLVTFFGCRRFRWHPIPVILVCALAGILFYGVLGL